MPRKSPPVDIDDVYRRNQAGETLEEIVRDLGVSRGCVESRLREAGIRLTNWGPRNRSNRPADDALHDLYTVQRKTTQEIADLYGVHQSTVRKWIRASSIVARTQAESLAVWYEGTTADERQRLTAAAHDAVRGETQTEEHRRKIARTRQRRYGPDGPFEEAFYRMLIGHGIEAVTQKAIGRFNVDFAAHSVAVEIFGGSWHNAGRHAARHDRRAHYILNAGWHLLIIWVEEKFGHPLTIEAADYAVSLMKLAGRNPSARREYRVIRGTGQLIISGCVNCDHFPFKPPRKANLPIRCNHLGATD